MEKAVFRGGRRPAEQAGAASPQRPPAGPGLQLAAKLARGADSLLTTALSLLLALMLAFACYALWDTWRIYYDAGIDDALLQYKPQLDGGENSASFAELRALNPDVCAWLTLDDTHIDYPVVQGTDNIRYVNTDVYGEFSLSGSIFLDCRNAADFTDAYSLIYGHHMEGQVMFGELASFREAVYFDQHTAGTLYLPDRTCRIEIFACLQTDAYDARVFSPGDLSQTEMEAFLDEIAASAAQYRDIGVTAQDHILALSTCSNASTNARTVVLGRLEEIPTTEGAA